MTPLPDRVLLRLRDIAAAPDLTGTPYTLVRELGRGGMGVVYAAEDERLGRTVALKVISGGADPERLEREARILAALEHPGIVPVHDVGVLADGRVFYAMKLVDGERLTEHLAREHSLADLIRLFLRICEPVAFAHARNVVHRDLKPENIMIGVFGEVLVMDWGVARQLTRAEDPGTGDRGGGTGTSAGTIIGTEKWMAPEQRSGELDRVDARSDVYALGRILDHMLGGRDAPRQLRAVVRKATSTSPEERYTTAAELAGDMARHLDGEAVVAYRENPAERAARFLYKHRALAAILATYVVVRALLFLLPRP